MRIPKSPGLQASKEGYSREEMNKTWSKTQRQIARLRNCVRIQTALMSQLSSKNAASHSYLERSAVWWKNRALEFKSPKLEALDWKSSLHQCAAWVWNILKSVLYAPVARLWAKPPILLGALPQHYRQQLCPSKQVTWDIEYRKQMFWVLVKYELDKHITPTLAATYHRGGLGTCNMLLYLILFI